MTCRSGVVVILIIGLLSVTLGRPAISTAAEFSADFIRAAEGKKFTSRVYVKGKMRREEMMEDGKLAVINIARLDKGVSWTLMPDQKMYMEISLEGTKVGAMEDIEEMEARAKMKIVGKETVNGYACEKRQYQGQREGLMTVWYSPKLNYPVKIHVMPLGGEGEMTMDYRNIKVGKIPDSKFEIPSGYSKFAMPGMPGGMPPGMPGVPGMGKKP